MCAELGVCQREDRRNSSWHKMEWVEVHPTGNISWQELEVYILGVK